MNVIILHQTPFQNQLYAELRKELSDTKNKSFRALVAYLSWKGIETIHPELEKFYERNKDGLKMIIGVGETNIDIDVLRYFKERMPTGYFRIFNAANPNYLYHPKIYIFDHNNYLKVFIGSSNFTGGGLYSNSECNIKLVLSKNKDQALINEIEEIWHTYNKPKPPFKKGNLKKLNNNILNSITEAQKKLVPFQRQNKKHNEVKDLFPSINIPNKLKHYKNPVDNKGIHNLKDDIGKVLLLEVLKETGVGGIQVQIPSEVMETYFKVRKNEKNKTIQIKVQKADPRPAVLCSFRNFTYRVTVNELSDIDRPLILKFIKSLNNIYDVQIIKGQKYLTEIIKCKNQTRKGAKRWYII